MLINIKLVIMTTIMAKELGADVASKAGLDSQDFLQKVMAKANVYSLREARSLVEIVFRTMRDLMTNEVSDDVSSELHTPISSVNLPAAKGEVSDLWNDSNPIVRFLSKVRPPLSFSDKAFLFRISAEGGLPQTTETSPDIVSPETVVLAVFGATKDELSENKISEIADYMPGKVRLLWEMA